MSRLRIWIMLGLIASLSAVACSNGNDCSLENVAYARFGFYNPEDKSVKLSSSVVLTVSAFETDSILVNQEKSPSGLMLPLGYTHEKDVYVLKYSETLSDTITVNHTNIPFFISMDCGTAMYHKVEGVTYTRNVIDSIRMVNPEINFDNHENFKIYYSTLLSD